MTIFFGEGALKEDVFNCLGFLSAGACPRTQEREMLAGVVVAAVCVARDNACEV